MDTFEVVVTGSSTEMQRLVDRFQLIRTKFMSVCPKKEKPYKPGDSSRTKNGAYPGWDAFDGKIEGKWIRCTWRVDVSEFKPPRAFVKAHLSSFRTHREFLDWLWKAFADCTDLILDGKLRRLDLCVDLDIPFRTVFETIYQKKVATVSAWDSGSVSVYFGKEPRITYAYEKLLPKSRRENGRSDRVTRVEVRLRRNKLPVASLRNLPIVTTISCPFDHLSFREFIGSNNLHLSAHATGNICEYLYLTERMGAQLARKILNQHGHFHRSVGQFLEPANIDLEVAWRERCKEFFGPGFNTNEGGSCHV